MELKEKIIQDINNNDIILYMKGTKEMPMCGFSSTVVNILNMHAVEYKATNVLENHNIRQELSKISNWPTIPQLFCNGELIGGCDIAVELHNNGQLEDILKLTNLSENYSAGELVDNCLSKNKKRTLNILNENIPSVSAKIATAPLSIARSIKS